MLISGISVISIAAALITCGAAGGFDSFEWLWVLPVSCAGYFLGLIVCYFLFLWLMCALVDDHTPPEKDSVFYRKLTGLTIGAILNIVRVRLHVSGMEQVPGQGRFLLVCNHLNIMDPVVLLHCFRKNQLAFISKKENNSMFIVGKLMHKIMCQLIDRENDREALKTILKCIQMIKQDVVSIAVFPEGYTSRDGKLHSFRNGVFKIAQKAQVPIVVCTVQNTQAILHNAAHFKPTDVYLHLLRVIPAEELSGVTTMEIGERVHRLMEKDLEPEHGSI